MTRDLSWLRQLPGKPLVVAEVKQRSPFTGWVNPLEPEEQLTLCEQVGDIISVHTGELWGGSWQLLADICDCTDKPILAKGFHNTVHDVKRALDIVGSRGAGGHVLTVGWDGGPCWEHCWMEVESLEQLSEQHPDQRCVWNARNPRTGDKRLESPEEWMGANESRHCLPEQRKPWLCQASHIRGPQDVVAGVDAVLIGEGLYT